MLSTEMIENVLGKSITRKRILTDEMKLQIVEMCESGNTLSEIVIELKKESELVKKDHVRNYLKRLLKNQLKESK
jgi:hypothetical protein